VAKLFSLIVPRVDLGCRPASRPVSETLTERPLVDRHLDQLSGFVPAEAQRLFCELFDVLDP